MKNSSLFLVRSRFHALAAAFVLASPAAVLRAETYYVAPMGSDAAPGSSAYPWATIQKACDSLKPGDTAIVRAGIYNEQVYFENSGNAEDGFITLRAEGKVVVTAIGLDDDNVFYIEDRSYLRIHGFEIRDLTTSDGSGIRVEGSGSHLEFIENRIHGIRGKNAMGITLYGTDTDRPLSDILVSGNEIWDCDAAPSEALTLNGNVTRFQVIDNHLHDIRGIGIDFIGGEKGMVEDRSLVARDGVCLRNRVERARANYGGGYGAGIYVDGGRNILIEHNIVSECDLGIEVGAENPGAEATDIEVRGNIVRGNDKAGLVFGGYSRKAGRVHGCRFLNNLVSGNTAHKKAEAELWIQIAGENLVRNNLIVGLPGAKRPLLRGDDGGAPVDLEFNLWFVPGGGAGVDLVDWDGKGFATLAAFADSTGLGHRAYPVDPMLAADGVHLSPGSPAIDAGDPRLDASGEIVRDLDGEERIQGAAVDLGPDEWSGGSRVTKS